jgi:hypothetical protein
LQCKDRTTNARHWDELEGQVVRGTLSAANFIISDGVNEAMQFDGVLNTGLLINENIVPLANARLLPVSSITVEAWFTINTQSLSEVGLISTFRTTAGCNVGWVLGYTINEQFVTFWWRLNRVTTATETFVFIRVLSASYRYAWTHLAATYDGRRLVLYLNGGLEDSTVVSVDVSLTVGCCVASSLLHMHQKSHTDNKHIMLTSTSPHLHTLRLPVTSPTPARRPPVALCQ